VALNGAVEELVDELADELDPQAESRAVTQPNVIATDRVRFDMIDRPTANIVR
jgi:hypothetical protein